MDDEHDSVDLDINLTVADVFVDKGKARTEGFDQHAFVRVIQKPIPYIPTRYPSVVQDWAGAAQENEGNGNTTRKYKDSKSAVHRFETIDEEPGPSASPDVTVNGRRNLLRDTPVSSVERDDLLSLTHPKTRSPRLEKSRGTEVISETRRLGSIELGSPDFRLPVVQNSNSIMAKIDHGMGNGTSTPSRKRKKSPVEMVSQKEPRLEKPNGRTLREDIPDSQTARNRSLSSAGSEKTGPSESVTPKKRGLGLGITSSPVFKRSIVFNPPDESAKSDAQQPTQPFFTGPVYAHNVPDSSDNLDDSALPKVRDSVLQEARKLHSALRGQSPSNGSPSQNSSNKATPGKGRSVSFAKPEKPNKLTPVSKSRPNAKERLKERLERETSECKNLKQRIDKLEENRGDLKYIGLLRKVQETLTEVLRLERNKQKNSAQRAKILRPELESYWKELEEYEASIGASPSQTENREPVTTPLPQKNNTDRNTDNKTPLSQGSVQSKSSRKTRSASVNGQTVPAPEKQSENGRSPAPSSSPVKPASAKKTPAAANSQVVEDVMDNTPVEKGSALSFGDDTKLLPSDDGSPVKTEPADMSSSSGSDGEEEYENKGEDKTESGSGSDDKTKVEIKNKPKSENESDNDSVNEDESDDDDDDDEEEEEEEGHNKNKNDNDLQRLLEEQLCFDVWYIVLGLFLITLAEGRRIQTGHGNASKSGELLLHEEQFTLFAVLFEIVAAYGTVGLSVGDGGSGRSFSGGMRMWSKVVILAMQVRGRHRGLPCRLDHAVLLPNEREVEEQLV